MLNNQKRISRFIFWFISLFIQLYFLSCSWSSNILCRSSLAMLYPRHTLSPSIKCSCMRNILLCINEILGIALAPLVCPLHSRLVCRLLFSLPLPFYYECVRDGNNKPQHSVNAWQGEEGACKYVQKGFLGALETRIPLWYMEMAASYLPKISPHHTHQTLVFFSIMLAGFSS